MITYILVLCLLVVFWLRLSKKNDQYPPGPYRWPIIGNLLEFKKGGRKPHQVAADLSSRYGNVVGLYLASKPVVIISGMNEIKEVLARPESQGRPPNAIKIFQNDVTGILSTQGESWKEQRRFAIRHLKDLGVGKRELETLIHEEIIDMLQDAKRMAGKDFSTPVPALDLINATGANVIYHLLAGKRFTRGDPQLAYLLKIIQEISENVDSSGGLIASFPFLLRYARWLTPYEKLNKIRMAVRNFLQETISQHFKDYKEEHFDYIDYYIAEINKATPNSSFHMKQLLTVCYDLFLAGSETSVGALSFALLYMVREPKTQAKIHEELDAQLGRDRLPTMEDKQKLPYVNATILEALRVGSIVPLALPHFANEEFQLGSYVIPKEARVIVNLYSMHMSKDIWGDPENFRPERFLDESGNLINHEALLPFGMGKRACPGESLARTNIFLSFTALLQHFILRIPDGEPTPTCHPHGSLTLGTRPFNIKLIPRKNI